MGVLVIECNFHKCALLAMYFIYSMLSLSSLFIFPM